MRKRIFAAFVCLCMLMALVPSMAYAGDTVSVGGLCEHHTQHDDACGYSEATAEVPCNHEHTEDCYTLVTNCVHEHTAECYSDGILPADGEEKTADSCSHQCSEESGCITKELNCKHEHDASCGYVPATAGTPCTYVCEICNAQAVEEPECNCDTKCTEEEVNADCPVCGGENGDISGCVGAEKAEEAQCSCDTKCTEEEPNADCPVCGGENGDISGCVGAAMMLAPMGARTITPEVPDGNGTKVNPYQIGTAGELYWFAGLVNGDRSIIGNSIQQNAGACAVLTDDITINTDVLRDDGSLNDNGGRTFEPWTPIGKDRNKFTGTFDGNRHTISGLYVDGGDCVGLFGYVSENGKIQNVGVKDSYVKSTGYYAGVGGVCGSNNGGTIINCYNEGTVTGTGNGNQYVGGVCGMNEGGIENCYNKGTVTGTGSDHQYVGGVCGMNQGRIENCYNTGEASGKSSDTGYYAYVGGVCGLNYSGTITSCHNTGEVSGAEKFAFPGGVCGRNQGRIENCYNTGKVTGTGSGGHTYTGGVCGTNDGTITNCYNTGEVSGTGWYAYIGGVCGLNQNTIENCYNTGKVSGGSIVGGVCGWNYSGTITSCYYLEGTAASSDGGDALSEYAFGVQGSFSGWDCTDVWKMDIPLGRPVLQSNKEESEDDCGNGTKDAPYLISNAGQLAAFASVVNSGNTGVCAVLTADIIINENVLNNDGSLNSGTFEQWTPIGDNIYQYTGTFDGNGHTISGLYVDSNASDVGLFGNVAGGTIKNVGVVDSYIIGTSDGAHVGGVCGMNWATIENCYNEGTVTGDIIGGVCGVNYNATIKNCYSTGKVTGDTVGGVCGNNIGGTITDCYFLTGTTNNGIGSGDGDVMVKTDSQFKSGEVAWLLNDGQEPKPWVQKLNEDSYPRLWTSESDSPYVVLKIMVDFFEAEKENAVYYININGTINYPSPSDGGTYQFFEDAGYSTWIDTATKTYDADTTIYAASPVESIKLNKTALSLYVNGTETLTATVTPENAYNKTLHWESDNPSVATVDPNGKVTAVGKGTATITAASIDGSGVQATCTVTVKKKSSGGSVFFWDLKFDTNGGSKIDTVTEWEYSTIDLDEYVPEKEGYKFVGWYADEDLTKKIDEVYLLEDTTVYAKWEKIEEEVPEEPEETEETEPISFKDVKESDWFYDAVSYAVENGLMSGISEDIFAPNTPLTREMLAVVLYNVEGQPESTGVNAFTDVKADMWYTDAILWANENGIVAGYDNGAYGVGDLITREQFAAILYRYAQFKGYDVSVGADTNILSYKDALTISEYAYPAMQWACGAGIMSGMDDGTLMPQGKATRAEAATMLMNFCENVMK